MISNCPVFKEDGFSAGLPTGVAYGFYGRQGGVSAPPYESLNCGMGSDDDPADITVNRSIVAQSLGVEAPSLLSLYQTHSADCRPVTALWPSEQRPEGDAFVTDRPGIALGILTADCAPVLFYAVGRNGPVVGAAHAGWRGPLEACWRPRLIICYRMRVCPLIVFMPVWGRVLLNALMKCPMIFTKIF